jgi:hypothetical protein
MSTYGATDVGGRTMTSGYAHTRAVGDYVARLVLVFAALGCAGSGCTRGEEIGNGATADVRAIRSDAQRSVLSLVELGADAGRCVWWLDRLSAVVSQPSRASPTVVEDRELQLTLSGYAEHCEHVFAESALAATVWAECLVGKRSPHLGVRRVCSVTGHAYVEALQAQSIDELLIRALASSGT